MKTDYVNVVKSTSSALVLLHVSKSHPIYQYYALAKYGTEENLREYTSRPILRRNVDDIADWIRTKCDLTKGRSGLFRVRSIGGDSFELAYLPNHPTMSMSDEVVKDIVAALDPKHWNDVYTRWLLEQVSNHPRLCDLVRTIRPYIVSRA